MLSTAPPVLTITKENPRPLKCPLPCAVCGDQSSGFHYDVPSCNGCKTFFRRTVLDRRVFKCWKGGNCMLEKGYRCTCRACRFKKCVQAGMNPRAIQAPPKDTTKPFPTIGELIPAPFMTPEATPSPISAVPGTTVNLVQIFLTLERDIEALRANTFIPPTILLDELTRPSALATVPKSDGQMASSLVHMDIETFVILEYAKAMNWFTQLRFTDKFTILAERTCPLLALRLSWYRSGSAFKDHLSNLLSPLVDAIRLLNMDKVSLSLMSVLLLSESCNLSLTPEATEELTRQKDAYASCLAGYLLQKHGVTSISQVGRHFTLLWTCLHVAKKLKNYLKDTLPADCFSRQIIDTAEFDAFLGNLTVKTWGQGRLNCAPRMDLFDDEDCAITAVLSV